MGLSCTRRHFVLSTCFLQMIAIIERQVFDFLGYMWAPICVNFFHIIFIILGFYGAYHFRIKYIITYLIWNLLWIGWNTFLICFYLEIGSLSKDSDLLNLGTGSMSWFEENGYGCKAIYSTNFTNINEFDNTNDPYRPLRPEHVIDCLLPYELVEIIHSGLQCFLACGGILGAILISYIFIDEDDRFDFVNGDAKSPQHTVVHPMYVSYSSIPTTTSGTMLAIHKLQQQKQIEQEQQHYVNNINYVNKDKMDIQKYDTTTAETNAIALKPKMKHQLPLNDMNTHSKNIKNCSTFVVRHVAASVDAATCGTGETSTIISKARNQEDYNNFHDNSYDASNYNDSVITSTQLHYISAVATTVEARTSTAINNGNSHLNTLKLTNPTYNSTEICEIKLPNAVLATAAPIYDNDNATRLKVYDDSTAKADHQFYGNAMRYQHQLQEQQQHHCESLNSPFRSLSTDSSPLKQTASNISVLQKPGDFGIIKAKVLNGNGVELESELNQRKTDKNMIKDPIVVEHSFNLLKFNNSNFFNSKTNDKMKLAYAQYGKIKQNITKPPNLCYNNFKYDPNGDGVIDRYSNGQLQNNYRDEDKQQKTKRQEEHFVNLKYSQELKENAVMRANNTYGNILELGNLQMEHFGSNYQQIKKDIRNYLRICGGNPSYVSINSCGLVENQSRNLNNNNKIVARLVNNSNTENTNKTTIHNTKNITNNGNNNTDSIKNTFGNCVEDILNENLIIQRCNSANISDNKPSINVIPQKSMFYQQNGLPFHSIYKPINMMAITTSTKVQTGVTNCSRPSNIPLPVLHDDLPIAQQRLGHSLFPDLSPDVVERYEMPSQKQQHKYEQHDMKRSPVVSRVKHQPQQMRVRKMSPHQRSFKVNDQVCPYDNNIINHSTHSQSSKLNSINFITSKDNGYLIEKTKSDDNLSDWNCEIERRINKNEKHSSRKEEIVTKIALKRYNIDPAPHVNRRSSIGKYGKVGKSGDTDIKKSVRPRSYCSSISQDDEIVCSIVAINQKKSLTSDHTITK